MSKECPLVAIAIEMDRLDLKKARVILAVGLPIGRLAKEKESFRQYLMSPKDVKCRFSGNHRLFR